jgi:hypothetical protein
MTYSHPLIIYSIYMTYNPQYAYASPLYSIQEPLNENSSNLIIPGSVVLEFFTKPAWFGKTIQEPMTYGWGC